MFIFVFLLQKKTLIKSFKFKRFYFFECLDIGRELKQLISIRKLDFSEVSGIAFAVFKKI